MNLENYAQYKETKIHEQPGFSYNTYLCTIPDDFEKVGLHWHDQIELIYIKKGRGIVSVDLTSHEVEEGCIVIVFPGQLHSIERYESSRMEYENIIFSLSMLESAETDWCSRAVFEPLRAGTLRFPSVLRPGTEERARAAAFVDAADHACDQKEAGYPLAVKGEMLLMFYSLYSYRSENAVQSAGKDAARVKQVLSWARDRYSERLTIEEAASIAGYSPSYFMRFFKENVGQTFFEYLIDYRLTAASRLLTETDENISEIALECGFENISYFCRSFKKKYGVTPRGARRERN